MTIEMKVPVTAPGAKDAADQMDRAADAAQRLANSEEKLAKEQKQAAGYARETANQMKNEAAELERAASAAKKFDAVMTSAGVKFKPVTAEMAKMRAEARKMGDELEAAAGGGGGGHGGHGGKGGAYWASRAFPGHEMQIQNIASAVPGAMSFMAPLLAAGTALFTVMKIQSELVERHNAVTMENIKVDQEMAKQARSILMTKQDNAAGGLDRMRSNMRYILYNDPNGAQGIKDANSSGMGERGISALAELIKNRGQRFGKGWNAEQFVGEANRVSGMTGLDPAEILEKMGSGQGYYNRDRMLRQIRGRTWNTDQLADFRENAKNSDLGKMLDHADYASREKNRYDLGNVLNPEVSTPGVDRGLQDYIDPMSKVIREHNFALSQSIEIEKTKMGLEQTYIDQLKTFLDSGGFVLKTDKSRAGVESSKLDTLKR